MLKKCIVCGKVFKTKHPHQTICGDIACKKDRKKYWNEIVKERRQSGYYKKKIKKNTIVSHDEILNQARAENTSYGKIVANEYIKQNPMERCEQYYIDHGMEVVR